MHGSKIYKNQSCHKSLLFKGFVHSTIQKLAIVKLQPGHSVYEIPSEINVIPNSYFICGRSDMPTFTNNFSSPARHVNLTAAVQHDLRVRHNTTVQNLIAYGYFQLCGVMRCHINPLIPLLPSFCCSFNYWILLSVANVLMQNLLGG